MVCRLSTQKFPTFRTIRLRVERPFIYHSHVDVAMISTEAVGRGAKFLWVLLRLKIVTRAEQTHTR
jgi:hypothetical protein